MKINSRIRNILGAVLAGGIMVGTVTACNTNGTSNNANNNERKVDQQSLTQLEQSDPIPSYASSMQRKNLIDIQNIEANATQTTTFFFQMGDPDPVYHCPSIAMPLSYSDQLTNPNQIIRQGFGNGNYADGVVAQADPTGVYTSPGSQGTDVVCVDSNGKGYAVYWEGQVMTFSYGATWNTATHSVNLVGAPTANVRTTNG